MLKNNSIYRLYYEWWKNIDKFIFFIIILLFITGLFFSLVSTSLIVSDKLETNDYTFFFKHLSIISFKPEALVKFAKAKKSRLEKIEDIELLRALEIGLKIK